MLNTKFVMRTIATLKKPIQRIQMNLNKYEFEVTIGLSIETNSEWVGVG